MSKYNAKKTTYKDIIFDSIAEADFYKMLLSEEAKGNVGEIVLQPSFRLQDGYNHNGKKVKPINYKADFMFKDITNDKLIVIDVKGMATEVANLKRKMFNYLFGKELDLIWVVKNKKYGNKYGFVEYNKLKKARKENKKLNT